MERFDGINDKRPSHKDIFEDLKTKKKENPSYFPKIIQLINEVWNCKEPDFILEPNDKEAFHQGLTLEMLLKILKWLFIEQDITYWNYDGREMLIRAIKDETKTHSQLPTHK